MKENKAYACSPTEKILDFWISNNLNVLFSGSHGTGKTTMVVDAFKRNNLKYRYFSASTMDPWVDFIGVPKEQVDEKGPYLDLIKPKDFRDDEIEAIFFDEFNRSHKKVRNAVMELIQFKSINGRKFPNLKIIWAAINPDDEDGTYDVEKLDPAQRDRFHIQIEIPNKPNLSYFRRNFNHDKIDGVIEWWNDLSDNVKSEISPRRLETILRIDEMGGNVAHAIPASANAEKLANNLKSGSVISNFDKVIKIGDESQIKDWLNIENNYSGVKSRIDKYFEYVHLLTEERISDLLSTNSKVFDFVKKSENLSKFEPVLLSIAKAATNGKLTKKILKEIPSIKAASISGPYKADVVKATVISEIAGIVTTAKPYPIYNYDPIRFHTCGSVYLTSKAGNVDYNTLTSLEKVNIREKLQKPTTKNKELNTIIDQNQHNTAMALNTQGALTLLSFIDTYCSKINKSSLTTNNKRYENVIKITNSCLRNLLNDTELTIGNIGIPANAYLSGYFGAILTTKLGLTKDSKFTEILSPDYKLRILSLIFPNVFAKVIHSMNKKQNTIFPVYM